MIQQKIDYDLWANQLIMRAIKKIKDPDILAESTRLFAHLFKAQVIWFNRVHGIEEKVDVWGDYTINECVSLMNDSHAMLEGISEKIGEDIEYFDTKGNPYKNRGADIFDHVIIHGQHHRAQILTLLRKTGIAPPPTDYIYYLRSII